MGLGVGDLLWASLLFINAIAVLNEERFLARIGWSTSAVAAAAAPSYDAYASNTADPSGASAGPSIKTKVVNLIGAVRTLMRIPLIAINLAIIIYELVLG